MSNCLCGTYFDKFFNIKLFNMVLDGSRESLPPENIVETSPLQISVAYCLCFPLHDHLPTWHAYMLHIFCFAFLKFAPLLIVIMEFHD